LDDLRVWIAQRTVFALSARHNGRSTNNNQQVPNAMRTAIPQASHGPVL
jgi:hypothetical protein